MLIPKPIIQLFDSQSGAAPYIKEPAIIFIWDAKVEKKQDLQYKQTWSYIMTWDFWAAERYFMPQYKHLLHSHILSLHSVPTGIY